MELSIDTSTRYASVALSERGAVTMEVAWRSQQNHSVELVPNIRGLMEMAGVGIEEVNAVFVAKGPGGFSALRVGLSVAKSLAEARSIPIAGISTLDVEAFPYLGLGLPVCALIDAGRTMVYATSYSSEGDTGGGSGEDCKAFTHDDFLDSARPSTLYCGEAAHTMEGPLRERLGAALVLKRPPLPTRRPAVLAQLGYQKLEAGQADSLDSLQPIYVRGAQFEAAQRVRYLAAGEVR